MQGVPGRTRALAALLAVLFGAVLFDQLVLNRGDDSDALDGALNSRDGYESQLALVEEKRQLVDMEEEIASALATTRDRWSEVRTKLVLARSPDLAEAAFRDRVLDVASQLGLDNASVSQTEARALGDDGRLRLLELRLEVDSPSTSDIYALVDRLEHMPTLMTEIAALRIDGPGRIQRPKHVSATITLRSIAFLGSGGESDG